MSYSRSESDPCENQTECIFHSMYNLFSFTRKLVFQAKMLR